MPLIILFACLYAPPQDLSCASFIGFETIEQCFEMADNMERDARPSEGYRVLTFCTEAYVNEETTND